MPKFRLRNHAGQEFIEEGRTLMEAKMKLCRKHGNNWNDLETGVTAIRLVEKLPAEGQNNVCV